MSQDDTVPNRHKSPLYVVLFDMSDVSEEEYSVFASEEVKDDGQFTVPHGFDRESAHAIPGIWYCLHLPNTFYELSDIPPSVMKFSQMLSLDHQIKFMPIQAFRKERIPQWPDHLVPALVVCPDVLLEEAERRSSALEFQLPVAPYSVLSTESLKEHWREMHQTFVPELPYLGREPTLSDRLDLAPLDLSFRWLARQMDWLNENYTRSNAASGDLISRSIWGQLLLAAAARMEDDNIPYTEANFEKRMQGEVKHLSFPVVLALPGVAPSYSKRAFAPKAREQIEVLDPRDQDDVWALDIYARTSALVERNVIEIMTTHRAIARGGIGLMLPSVPDKAFATLAKLERHFIDGPKARTVWKILDQLNEEMAPFWIEGSAGLIARASTLTAFTNFPIGLLRIPGDSAPLSSRVPISYKPLTPLTRALQKELEYTPIVDLSGEFRVLVVECISKDDPVGQLSRIGWSTAQEMTSELAGVMTIDVVEVDSIEELHRSVAEKSPHFLVISAHGIYETAGNLAALSIGKDPYYGEGLWPSPPVVILSACHVAPRGSGAISVTDLLLREGAAAILGTQIPVDVRHNAILMGRFFANIAEALEKQAAHRTLLDVWHHTQASNAIHDILSGCPSLQKWGRSRAASGLPVMLEFMLSRSRGRLRKGFVYEDTEKVLGEIADEQGKGVKVRNWFRSPGYVPESLFYVFVGNPERIHLKSPEAM